MHHAIMSLRAFLTAGAWALAASTAWAQAPLVVSPRVLTSPLHNYEDAPATPDADDPAIWVNRQHPQRSLAIGTAKDAGLLVYDLRGRLIQALRPPNAPRVLPADPATPSGVNLQPDQPCVGSATGETFGRFNNVDIAYDVRLGHGPSAPKADVAIVSDRGCDRVRFYRIDPTAVDGPLVDVTAPDVPRVFPVRYDQPSAVQPSGEPEGWRDNPVDDQHTVYGLTVAQRDDTEVFVSSRERGLLRHLKIVSTAQGRLTYEGVRTFVFDTSFVLKDRDRARYAWTPCREAVQEEPQAEGLVYDSANDTLYVAFETIGLYRLPLRRLPALVLVGADQLLEPITSFGRAYRATPDDDEFSCEYDAEGVPEPGAIEVPGSDANAGAYLQADLEGLSVVASAPGLTFMLASSQGDSSFHFYLIDRRQARHAGAFFVEGVEETDGVHYAPVPLAGYPAGLLVVQNGAAPERETTDPIDGYEFDGSTQFVYVNFLEALRALRR
jgi:3-phytase